ncbi:MAG: LacI family DNA-binding transcriptional regulator [Nakamurella sp.]
MLTTPKLYAGQNPPELAALFVGGSVVSEIGADEQGGAPRRPPGLYDVGKLAGVSHQTVSRVLNSHPSVRPETRKRVLDAISQLGYRRNTAARALVTRKSATIGIITPASPLFGPTSTLLSMEWAARDAGYFVSVASVRLQDRLNLSNILEHFMSQAVEGIVVIAPQDFAAEVLAKSARDVPTVVVADTPSLAQFDSVSVDQSAGASMAVTHLVELGHREIVHVSGPADWFDARARVVGWRTSMELAKLPAARMIQGDWTAESGYQAGIALIGAGLPDAIFAANDEMALGLLRAFRQRGVSVPDQVSVVGFDDVAGSAYFDPPLTTVRQDFEALGTLAMRSLQEWLSGNSPRVSISQKIRPTLIVRESSGIGLNARTVRRTARS